MIKETRVHQHLKLITQDKKTNRVFIFLCLNLFFALVEAIYGALTDSLGLTSDAIHMVFDCSAIALGLIATAVSKIEANDQYTYGYSRVETLTGFVSGLLLVFASVSMVIESVERFYDPHSIDYSTLFVVSVLGLFVNCFGLYAFDHGHHSHHHHHGTECTHGESPVMHGMFLHVFADTMGSVGVILSSLLIKFYGWTWSDPLCSLLIALMTITGAFPLIKMTGQTLLQRIPLRIEHNIPQFRAEVLDLPQVSKISQLHIWELSSDHFVCTIHLNVTCKNVQEIKTVISRVKEASSRNLYVDDITVHLDT